MRKFILTFIVIVFCSLIAVQTAQAGDIFNNGTVYITNPEALPSSGDVIGVFEDVNTLVYVWRFTYVDSSDNYHSKPLYIGDCNVEDAYISCVGSTAGDVNPIAHYSSDNRTNWTAVTLADLDATAGTAKGDTLGTNDQVNEVASYHVARWLVLEAASGSSANDDGNVFTTIIKFRKTDPKVMANGDYIRMGRVATRSNTNP